MSQTIRVMLVEDSTAYRKVMGRALQRKTTIEICSQFGTAEIALRHLQTEPCPPDVILLDYNLPGINALEALPYFIEYAPKAKIILLTQSDKKDVVMKSIGLGACGYLLKSSSAKSIIDSIEHVIKGGASIDSKVTPYLLDQIKSNSPAGEIAKTLSRREQEILELLADGLPRKEIAEKYNISVSTVVTHINRLYLKLEVPNAPAAIKKAYQVGLLKLND